MTDSLTQGELTFHCPTCRLTAYVDTPEGAAKLWNAVHPVPCPPLTWWQRLLRRLT